MQLTFLYHITHLNNLPGILNAGGLKANNGIDPRSYTNISHRHIQNRRAKISIPCGPRGSLHHYVPFFFSSRPPMLYSLYKRQLQQDIIYIVTSVQKIRQNNHPFVFSDGHATMQFTSFYDDLSDLDKIDWPLMQETFWRDTIEDGDRQRRKQAEFLIHQFVPFTSCLGIAVANSSILYRVKRILTDHQLDMYVKIRPDWYY